MSAAGPDGFPLAPDDRLHAAHARLDGFLIADQSRDRDAFLGDYDLTFGFFHLIE